MKFWDASAVVPLLVTETPRDELLAMLGADPTMIVWWGTPVECTSALARREREGALGSEDVSIAMTQLRELAGKWHEVLPSERVRTMAQRLLRVHALRAADALQLAAAIVAAEGDPASLELVCIDDRMNDAASREGFRIFRP
jgi:predicted nucleic acid-binding protein